VGLPRGPKVRIGPQVQLAIAELKPAAATAAQFSRLRDLGQPKQLGEEDASLVLTALRNCDLDVIKDGPGHQTVAISGASSAFIPTTL
jgi:hypothetical protein